MQAVKLFSTLTARCLSIQSSTQTCSVQSGEESSELSNTVVTRCISLSIQCSNEHSSVTSDEESNEASFGDLVGDGYTSVYDNDHFVLPCCRRSTNPSGCCDAVFITEADLEGYETYADTCDDAISVDIVVRHKPIMRRLSCFLGSLKITGNCEPPPNRLTEVRAC
jgi:atypical dual specificity phosphatase